MNSMNNARVVTCWQSLQEEVAEESLSALLETDVSHQGLVDV